MTLWKLVDTESVWNHDLKVCVNLCSLFVDWLPCCSIDWILSTQFCELGHRFIITFSNYELCQLYYYWSVYFAESYVWKWYWLILKIQEMYNLRNLYLQQQIHAYAKTLADISFYTLLMLFVLCTAFVIFSDIFFRISANSVRRHIENLEYLEESSWRIKKERCGLPEKCIPS